MNTRIYVENLAPGTSVAQLTNLFNAYGNVQDVNLAVDQFNQPLSFGFVTMVTAEGTRAAI
jgi:RNA recognition motif-containing protein